MSVIASYASRMSCALAGIRSKPRQVSNHLASGVRVLVALLLVWWWAPRGSLGAESNSPSPATSQIEETNSQPVLQAYLALQEQLRATQAAIEQNRQETKAAAAQNAESVSNALRTIQEAFSVQRARDLAAMQRSNQVMLIVAGTYAAIGFLTMLIMTCFQWRMSKGLAGISAALPTALELGPGSAAAALGPAEGSNLRLLGTIEQHERRIHELEQNPHVGFRPREATAMSDGNWFLPEAGAWLRRRRLRALGMAVIVGLICALGLALLLYVVTCRRWGLG